MYTKKDFRIAIIGSGIGGLTCALSLAYQGFECIHVFETAPKLSAVGAGIQLAPNMARVLDRLGLWDKVVKNAVPINETHIKDGPSNTDLARVDNTSAEHLYGYPQMVVHRADLIDNLYDACKAHAPVIQFHLGTSVEQILSFGPNPTLRAVPLDGAASYDAQFDVIIGCDGIKSKTRESLLQHLDLKASAHDTGYSAYRLILPRAALSHDPALEQLIATPRATRWIGPNRHIIGYPISAHSLYNVVAIQPDTNFAAVPSPDTTYTTPASKAALLATYADFPDAASTAKRLLHLVPDDASHSLVEWKLRSHQPLPTWTTAHVALLGDACHPALPFIAQGAAQAVEDAAVLAIALSQMVDSHRRGARPGKRGDVPGALRAYEALRKGRAEAMVELAAENGRVLHMAEGSAEREERDRAFREGGRVPDRWADAEVQRTVFGFDCVGDALGRGEGLVVREGDEVAVREEGEDGVGAGAARTVKVGL